MLWSHQKQGESGMGNPLRTQLIHNTKTSKNKKYAIQKTKMMCSSDTINNRGNQEWAHNTQYEDKQTYTTQTTEHMSNTDRNKTEGKQE